MDNLQDPVTAATGLGIAGYVAIIINCVACGQWGWSDERVRSVALLLAAGVALVVALDFLGRRWRNVERGGRR